jgi:hypothetical protein
MTFGASDRPVTQSDYGCKKNYRNYVEDDTQSDVRVKVPVSDCKSIERINAEKELAEFLGTDADELLSFFHLSQSEGIMNI